MLLKEEQFQSSEREKQRVKQELMRKESELTRAEETIRREQQQIQEMRRQLEKERDRVKVLEGGKFEGYGVVKLRRFCSLGVYVRWFIASLIWTLKPCARLYYTNIKPRSFEFHLYIVPDLDAILEVCQNH